MLEVCNLEVVYNDVLLALRALSIKVPNRKIVALLGSNGAGKTTTLRALSGLLHAHRGKITKGEIIWNGVNITNSAPSHIVSSGITQVMEGRRIFAELTVHENLTLGSFAVRKQNRVHKQNHHITRRNTKHHHTARHETYSDVMEMFPVLKARRKDIAGYLSGGEQQMLAIGRALMAQPKLLVLDEPSLGLAPILIEQIREIIVDINKQGVSVLLIEQNAAMALSIADYGYIMESGKVVMDGEPAELMSDDDVKEFYLGIRKHGERKSFKDVKHYRRRKQWLA